MGKSRSPRHGSMQFWPRVRSQRESPKVRSWNMSHSGLLGFVGYKAGMTHVQYTDPAKTSLTKGQVVSEPVTIVECPPITVIGIRVYSITTDNHLHVTAQFNAEKLPLEVRKRIPQSKNPKKLDESFDVSQAHSVRLVVATQPQLAGFGKKTSDIVEMAIGGSVQDQFTFAKDNLGKTISVEDVFKSGELIDTHAVTTGKGYQGPVKRFGVAIRQAKSEKVKRGPGSLGPWKGQGHIMYRIAMAGKMGYHLRTDYNKRIELVSQDITKVNPVSGISRYGLVKTTFLLVRGSISGPKKRLVTLTKAIRPNKRLDIGEVDLDYISVEAQN
ncbi:MAG: 50S ribosomal protein L3 [Candidatus Woesearchaeota archaeon]